MAQTKKITGNLVIDPTGEVQVLSDLAVTGNLNVTGTQTVFNTVTTDIQDRQITLNEGESAAGVTGVYSGLQIDRGSLPDAWLVFDESVDAFRVSFDNGSSFSTLLTSAGGGLTNVVEDTTPQLGGDLDINGKNIVSSVSNQDINFVPNGTGNVGIEGGLKLMDQGSAPGAQSGATVIYAGTSIGGGTGVFVVDGTQTDELASRRKAVLFGLIF